MKDTKYVAVSSLDNGRYENSAAILSGIGFFAPWIFTIAPYFSVWQLFFPLVLLHFLAHLRFSDVRLYHSDCLLPLLVAHDELKERGMVLTVVSSCSDFTDALTAFLQEISITVRASTVDQVPADILDSPQNLLLFHLTETAETEAYLATFAGRHA